jgi:Zn-dependent protease with chaperone function
MKKKVGPMLKRIAVCALVAGLAGACASSNVIEITPEELEAGVLRLSLHNQERLANVGLPLLASAAPQCGLATVPTLGATFLNPSSFQPWDQQAARTILGTDDRLQAVTAVPRLAGAAGLQKGDILLAIGGEPAPTGETAVRDWVSRSEFLMRRDGAVDIRVLRAGQEIALRLPATPVCGYRMQPWNSADIFARTTGEEINVTAGLIFFAGTDRELAVVLSHELAHNLLNHLPGPGSSARASTSTARDQVEQELEADYVGLYLMAAAGMEIDGADAIWRRMRDTFPDGEPPAGAEAVRTHPTHAARLAAFQDWIAEIKAKQAKGLPLTPEKRDWSLLLAKYGSARSQPTGTAPATTQSLTSEETSGTATP